MACQNAKLGNDMVVVVLVVMIDDDHDKYNFDVYNDCQQTSRSLT